MKNIVQILKNSDSEITKVIFVTELNYNLFVEEKLASINKFKGSYKQIILLQESNTILVGTTKKDTIKYYDEWNKVDFYELGALVIKSIAKLNLTKFSISGIQNLGIDNSREALKLTILGILQGNWSFDKYISSEKSTVKSLEIFIQEKDKDLMTEEIQKELIALNEGVTLTRKLIDETPEKLNPTSIKKIIQDELGDNKNITIKLIEKSDLEKMGMNAILAVGRASIHNPVLAHIILKPSGKVKNKVVLVGKGLTYDSGGLDIKIGGFMKSMKMDMGGSATMFGTIKALSLVDIAHTEIHWISAFVENMVGGNAYKSDDILESYSGQTIEVLNTDAEGRLTLADALAYATLQDPDYIIDAATLTGACVRALTEHFTAMMGNDKGLIDRLQSVFQEEQEKTIYVPMGEVLREQVNGEVSDLINLAKDPAVGGHITAGLFLSHFVDQNLFRNKNLKIKSPKAYSWVHLDIAGSAYNNKKNSILANGATGQTVRSLYRFVKELDKE